MSDFWKLSGGTNLAKESQRAKAEAEDDHPEDFLSAAEAWLKRTNGATLSEEVIDLHPALDALTRYAEEDLGMDTFEAGEFASTLLRQITMAADGGLLWRHESTEGIKEVQAEWLEDVETVAAVGLCPPPDEHPERHAYDVALKLLDDKDETMPEIRAMVKKHAIDDAKFTGEEPPGNVVSITTNAKPKDKPKPKHKPKHHQWLESLLEDDDVALARIAESPMVVEGLIPAKSYGYFFGESGAKKSFVVLDICHCVATGRPWLGDDQFNVEEPGLVVFVAAEGANGVRVRKRAIEEHTGIPAPKLHILPAAPLMDTADGHLLAETLLELERLKGEKVRLVVFDTLSATAEGEQNSATDMAKFISGCAEVKDNGAAVVVIHHCGHGDKDRMRGTTNLKAAGDFEFLVKSSDGGLVTVKQTKNKDEEELPPIQAKVRKVTLASLPKRRNGKPFTSLVVDPANLADQLKASRQLSANEQTLLDILLERCDGHAIGADEARDAFCDAKPDTKRASARQAFTRARKALVERQLIHDEDDCLMPSEEVPE